MTRSIKEAIKVCKVTGKEFLAIGARTISDEGRKINAIKAYEDYRAAHMHEPKFRAKRAEEQRNHRARVKNAGPEVAGSQAYHNRYMRDRPIIVDGVEYNGYRKTPSQLEYGRDYYRKTQYKTREFVSKEKRDELLAYQNNVCPILLHPITKDNADLDHCNMTGKARGYLIPVANTGIGFAHHNPLYLRTLADQLDAGTVNRKNARNNNVLGRIPTSDALRRAADFIEHPPYDAIRDLPENSNEPANWSWQKLNKKFGISPSESGFTRMVKEAA